MNASLPVIHVHYHDVEERGPRQSCGFFSLHRRVTNIRPVSGGEAGDIQYKGRSIPVYRRSGPGRIWTTERSILGPIKITYLH